MAFLTARELKLYLMGVGFLTLIALLVTALIMLLGGGGDTRSSEDAEATRVTREAEVFATEDRLVSRMEVPAEYRSLFEADWKPFREIHESWSRAQIAPYWIEPEKIVEQQLKKESDEAVESFLEELP